MWADEVEIEGAPIGVTTSRGFSYWFRRTLSLAVLDVQNAEVGTDVTIRWGNPGDPIKSIRGRVAPAPYKTPRSRADLHGAV